MKMTRTYDSEIKLFVRQDTGSGKPIVLLHGLFADGTQWEAVTKLLEIDFRVIVVDLLGHGRSPRPESATYTAAEHATALHNALDDISATQDVTIVGYSIGGDVAVAYAAMYPQGIEQLYLISAPFYLNPDQMIASHYAGSVLVTESTRWFFKTISKLLGPGKILSKLVVYADRSELFHKMIGSHDNRLDAHIIDLCITNTVKNFDFAGSLAKVTAPTTFYAGKRDPFIVQGQLYALRKFNPLIDIRRLDIIKIDHMLVQNLPREIVELITANKTDTLHVGFDDGRGEPLVLLHGIESSSGYWSGLAPTLAEHNRVICLDLLGFGQSPKPKNIAYSLDDQVAWLHRTLAAMHVGTFRVAGHSLGALVALAFAAKYPHQVRQLVMISPVILPVEKPARKVTVRALLHVGTLPGTAYFYAQAASVLGDDRLQKYLPFARSMEHAVHKQETTALAKQARDVPTAIYYGVADPLIDSSYIEHVAEIFETHKVTAYPKKGHNFAIFEPELVVAALDGTKPHSLKPIKTSIIPPSFLQQLSKLAVPWLFAKGGAYVLLGLLLFGSWAPNVLVIGLSVYVILQGYKTVRGAFSLKNEGLSYVGYALLGIATALIGLALYKFADESLRLAVYAICGLFVVVGLSRVFVALKWTKSKLLKRSLLLTGVPMTLLGIAAFCGSTKSIYFIIYIIAAYLIAKGMRLWWYGLCALAMAFVRGFAKM